MNNVNQLVKTVVEHLLRIEVKTEYDEQRIKAGTDIATLIIPMICDDLCFPWTASDSPVCTFSDGSERPAYSRKLRTRFDLTRLHDDQYYVEFAAELAEELNLMLADRTVAFYGIIKPMGVLGDKLCLATRYAVKTQQSSACWRHHG